MEYSYVNRNTANTAGGNGDSAVLDMREEKARLAAAVEEVKKEWQGYWEKEYAGAEIFPAAIAVMHQGVVDFLLSFDLVSVYDNIAKQAGLDAKGRNRLAHVVWQIAETKNWNGLEQELQKQLALAPNTKSLVLQLLEQNVLSKVRAISEKSFAKKDVAENEIRKEVRLPLAQALQEYPKLGEQNITINSLKLRYFPTPVRPSIKNWMTDFHDNMGAGKHGAVDRGNYLFHSENGKKLTPIERQKLSAILKSLDEQTPLSIDAEAQSIIFQHNAPIIKNQEIGSQKYTDDEKQKNIFPKNTTAVEFSSDIKNENFKNIAAIEDNYFQLPKSQSKTELTPKTETIYQESNPSLESNNHSPNFKNNTESNLTSEQKTEDANRNNFKDFTAIGGKMSFSSPQKLPNEIEKQPSQSKVNKNIVDLRN